MNLYNEDKSLLSSSSQDFGGDFRPFTNIGYFLSLVSSTTRHLPNVWRWFTQSNNHTHVFFYQFSKMCVDKWRICKIFGSFYRFVRLFWLCDLAWKSSLLHNKICSIDQIFFMTFQFQVSKVNFYHHFVSF